MAACATCTTTDGLQVCLYCGRAFCSNHRADAGGVQACTGCLAAERARSDRLREAAAARGPGRPARGESDRSPSIGSAVADVDVELRVAAPTALAEPDPPFAAPLALAVLAAAPTALYLDRLLGWLARANDLPPWTRPAGTITGTSLVLAAVWIIARSRLTR